MVSDELCPRCGHPVLGHWAVAMGGGCQHSTMTVDGYGRISQPCGCPLAKRNPTDEEIAASIEWLRERMVRG